MGIWRKTASDLQSSAARTFLILHRLQGRRHGSNCKADSRETEAVIKKPVCKLNNYCIVVAVVSIFLKLVQLYNMYVIKLLLFLHLLRYCGMLQ